MWCLRLKLIHNLAREQLTPIHKAETYVVKLGLTCIALHFLLGP